MVIIGAWNIIISDIVSIEWIFHALVVKIDTILVQWWVSIRSGEKRVYMEWSNLSFIISNSQFIMDLKVLEPFRTYISIALLQNRGGFHFPLSPHNLSSHGELLHNYLISLPHSLISCWWRKKYSARVLQPDWFSLPGQNKFS